MKIDIRRLVISLGVALVSTAAFSQDNITANLLANPDFGSDLSGWTEEDHPDFSSNWDPRNYLPDQSSGSFRGAGNERLGLGGADVGWQCIDVEPGATYEFGGFARRHPDNQNSSPTGTLIVSRVDDPGCPTSVEHGSHNFGASTHLNPTGATWVSAEGVYTIPHDISRIRFNLNVVNADGFSSLVYPTVLVFDHVWFGRRKPQLRAEISTTNATPNQGENFTLKLGVVNPLSNSNDARQVSVDITHAGRLRLAGEFCPGTVSEVLVAGVRRIRWSGIGTLPKGQRADCDIVVSAELGSDAITTVRAQAASSDGNGSTLDATVAIQSQKVPDMTADVTLTPFPPTGGTLMATLRYRNLGNASGLAFIRVHQQHGRTWARAAGDTCSELDSPIFDGTGATGHVQLAPGAQYQCSYRLQIPSDFSGPVGLNASASITNDYDASNNADQDSTRVVSLRVNRSADGFDRTPGDGTCEQTQGAGDCTLRGAVMEANALGAGRVIEIPYSATPYQLTSTSGDDDVLKGDVDIRTRMIVRGVPAENGARPIVQAAFPTASPARIFSFDPGGSSLSVLEQLVLSGQGLAIPTTDEDGHGGLVHHASGELHVRDVVLRDGRAGTLRRGGGLYSAAALTLTRVEAHDNVANAGGGIAIATDGFALVNVIDSHFHGNEAIFTTGAGGSGGGLHVDADQALVGISGSTLAGNHARFGGGLAVQASPNASLRNSTVSGNTASHQGGGIHLTNTALPIRDSTIAYNEAAPGNSSAGEGGGIWHNGDTPTLRNSLLVYNLAQTSSGGFVVPVGANCKPSVITTGYNTFTNGSLDSSCAMVVLVGTGNPGDTPNGGPSLTPLQDNAGPTPTHALASTGNEVDQGDCGSGLGETVVDQRGAIRPADGDGNGSLLCDKGAYELSDSARISVVKGGSGTGLVFSAPSGINCGGVCEALFGLGAEVTLTANTPAGNLFTGWGGACAAFGTAPCVLEAGGNLEVEALFESLASTHTLTVSVGQTGNGTVSSDPSGIDCPAGCSNAFATGTPVTLTAAAAADSVFLGFFGAGCDGSTDPCTITMDADRSVSALFDDEYIDLDVTLAGSGVGRVVSSPIGVDCPGDCADKYPAATSVTLEAQPAVGSVFTGWSGACSGTGTCALDMDLGPHEATATFDMAPDRLFGDGFE